METPSLEKLLTPAEVAELLGITPGLLQSWIAKHLIPVQFVRRHARFRPSDLAVWLEAQQDPLVRAPDQGGKAEPDASPDADHGAAP